MRKFIDENWFLIAILLILIFSVFKTEILNLCFRDSNVKEEYVEVAKDQNLEKEESVIIIGEVHGSENTDCIDIQQLCIHESDAYIKLITFVESLENCQDKCLEKGAPKILTYLSTIAKEKRSLVDSAENFIDCYDHHSKENLLLSYLNPTNELDMVILLESSDFTSERMVKGMIDELKKSIRKSLPKNFFVNLSLLKEEIQKIEDTNKT